MEKYRLKTCNGPQLYHIRLLNDNTATPSVPYQGEMHPNRSQNTRVPSSAEATTPLSPSPSKESSLKTSLITRSPAAPSTKSKKSPNRAKKLLISVIYYPQQNVLPSQHHPTAPQQANAQPPASPTTQTPKKRKPHDLDPPRSTWIDLTRHLPSRHDTLPPNRQMTGVSLASA